MAKSRMANKLDSRLAQHLSCPSPQLLPFATGAHTKDGSKCVADIALPFRRGEEGRTPFNGEAHGRFRSKLAGEKADPTLSKYLSRYNSAGSG